MTAYEIMEKIMEDVKKEIKLTVNQEKALSQYIYSYAYDELHQLPTMFNFWKLDDFNFADARILKSLLNKGLLKSYKKLGKEQAMVLISDLLRDMVLVLIYTEEEEEEKEEEKTIEEVIKEEKSILPLYNKTSLEKKWFTIFIRLEDGTAKRIKRKGYTFDEVEDRVLNEGYKIARYETHRHYQLVYAQV